jgi:hypothetical protein
LINSCWKDGEMADGFRAMLEAIKLYRQEPIIIDANDKYKEIVNYNELDCRVMWEIVQYLRENHCRTLN